MAPVFFPPELAAQGELEGLESDVLPRGSDRMRQLYFHRQRASREALPELDRQLVEMVLEHARRVIAHPSRPRTARTESFRRYPFADLDLEATLEDSPLLDSVEDLCVEISEERPFSCVAMLDCSSSMSGEKHLLASIAVAVLLLEVHARDAALVTFASQATSIKSLSVDEPLETTVLRFLRHRSRGFTNIGLGLRQGLAEWRKAGGRRRRIGLIATDGRTTEGKDPLDVAHEFDSLVVLHLHGPGSHIEASQAMAQRGHGICLEVERLEELPRRLYDALRMLARG